MHILSGSSGTPIRNLSETLRAPPHYLRGPEDQTPAWSERSCSVLLLHLVLLPLNIIRLLQVISMDKDHEQSDDS
jgi:hypothetical protein